ncbi:MAG: YdcF family protein [Mariprofundaceae bacterium]|nr:YdcF family protein [Mariprofundaceae bacterium]
MLLMSKALSQLILPPGGLIILAILGLIYWRRFWGRALVALVLLLFWLLSIEPVRDVLAGSLEHQYAPISLEEVTAQYTVDTAVIVILGGGVQENSLDYQGEDILARFAMMRAIYGAKIAQATDFDVLVTGGAPLREGMRSEAALMRQSLLWLGVDDERITTESQANTTWDNAQLSQNMLAKRHINTVIVVTSAWHMPRAVWCFEAFGVVVVPAPTDYLSAQSSYDIRSFLPRWNVFGESGHILHEYLGLMWYQWKYGSIKEGNNAT